MEHNGIPTDENGIPNDAALRVEWLTGWEYYSAAAYQIAMDDAKWRSQHATDEKVRVESRWLSDRTKWQPHGFYLQGLWTGASS